MPPTFTAAVGYRLRGKRCQAFNSDMKVRVPPPPRERFYYADASIELPLAEMYERVEFVRKGNEGLT